MDNFGQKKREILDRVNILEVVSEHVQLRRSGRRWVGLCPFHTEKTPSFTVTPDRGFFKCFGCGKGGDVITFLQLRENMPFMDALRFLADRAGVSMDDIGRGTASGMGQKDLADVNRWGMLYFRRVLLDSPAGQNARDYLKRRDVSDAMSERFSLGVALGGGDLLKEAQQAGIDRTLLIACDLLRSGDDGREYETFRNRLMFPIQDVTGRVIGFGGRTLGDDRAKYLNTRRTTLFDKGRHLYGTHLARESIRQKARVVVVEGYTDCLAAHQAGFTEVVATMGTALTEAHVALLRRYTEEVLLVFDSDRAGEAAADRAMNVALPACMTVRLVRLPVGEDPSDFLGRAGADEFDQLLKGATEALEFKWIQTQSHFKANESPLKRREAVDDFLRIVAESVDTHAIDVIQRGLIINQIAHLLKIGREEVSRFLSTRQNRRRATTNQHLGNQEVTNRPAAIPDAEQAAWTRVLEVLLNEPGLLTTLVPYPNFERIADSLNRRIATLVGELVTSLGDVGLTDILARFHSPQEVERVTQLAHRGEQRGNYQETLRSSLVAIGSAAADDHWDLEKQHWSSGQNEDVDSEDTRSRLLLAGETMLSRRGYVPRRFHSRSNEPGLANEDSSTTTTVE